MAPRRDEKGAAEESRGEKAAQGRQRYWPPGEGRRSWSMLMLGQVDLETLDIHRSPCFFVCVCVCTESMRVATQVHHGSHRTVFTGLSMFHRAIHLVPETSRR